MISHRTWPVIRSDGLGGLYRKWREGWYLFGLIPLYIRDGKE
jgi:hypothetical protein